MSDIAGIIIVVIILLAVNRIMVRTAYEEGKAEGYKKAIDLHDMMWAARHGHE
jgi:hypothetical protein